MNPEVPSCQNRVLSVLRPYRELAFQCCAKVSSADGDFVAEEDQVLTQLQALFGFTQDDVRRLLVLAPTRAPIRFAAQ